MEDSGSVSSRSASSDDAIIQHATQADEESGNDEMDSEQGADVVCEHKTSPALVLLDTEDMSVSPADDTEASAETQKNSTPDTDTDGDVITPAHVQVLDAERSYSGAGAADQGGIHSATKSEIHAEPEKEQQDSNGGGKEEFAAGDEKNEGGANEEGDINSGEFEKHETGEQNQGGNEASDKESEVEGREEDREAGGRDIDVEGDERAPPQGEEMDTGRNTDVGGDQATQRAAAAALQVKPLEFETDMTSFHTANWEHFSDSDSDDYFHTGADMEKLGSAAPAGHKDGGVHFSRRCSRPESVQDELDAIQCPICLGCLCEPLRLRCAHAFCRLCVISWTHTTRADGRSCPLCRAPIHMHDPFTEEVDLELDLEVQRLLSKEEYHESLEASIKQTAQLKQARNSAPPPLSGITLAPPHRRRHWQGPRVQGEMAELPLFLRQPPINVGERVELELRSLGQRVMAQRLQSSPQLLVVADELPSPPLRGVLVLVERCRPLARGVGVKMTVRGLEEGTIQMVRRETAGTVEVPYARLLVRNEEARAVISSFRSYLWAHDTPPGIVDMLEDEGGLFSCLHSRCCIT